MTIAAAYLSPEGVVLAADSTTTSPDTKGSRYFNNAQKIFEIGQDGTMGAVTWGLGGLQISSYRTLFAIFHDSFRSRKVKTFEDASKEWSAQFWAAYTESASIKSILPQARDLAAKKPFDPKATYAVAGMRTDLEENILNKLIRENTVGFCLAGYMLPDRTPRGSIFEFSPTMTTPKPFRSLSLGMEFWGAPATIQRIQFGIDLDLKEKILASPHWTGTKDDLDKLVKPYAHVNHLLPIRDAIDFLHSNITTTIKTLRFCSSEPTCGGPVEVGFITSDRGFRWATHKDWNSAIRNGKSDND